MRIPALTLAAATTIVGSLLVGAAPVTAQPASGRAQTTTVHAKIVQKPKVAFMVGFVKPHPKSKVIISRARTCHLAKGTCDFKPFAKQAVDRDNRFKVEVTYPKHGNYYWQARVGSSKSDIWVTCKTVGAHCST